MTQYRFHLLAVMAVVCLFASLPAHAQVPEFRAFWADAFHDGFKTPSQVDQLLSDVKSANCNAVVVQMRRRGDTYYPSPYEPFAADADPTFDALAYLIDKAHNQTPKIEVHAWLCTLPIWNSAAMPTNAAHPANLYPQYLTKNEAGATWDGSGYVFDPGHPGALNYITSLYMDVAKRYDVDGIHFDYVRFYGDTWGYNDISVGRFNSRYGRSGYPDPDDELWRQWRRDQVTSLVRRVYANAIALKPGIKVSASTIPWGDGPTDEEGWFSTSAYNSVFQDWRAWMEEGILDINMPMCYDREYDAAQRMFFEHWIAYAKGHKYNRQCVIGPGIYLNSILDTIKQYKKVRTLPGMYDAYADGICGYSYAVTNKDGFPFSEFLQALTQPSVYDPDPTPLFAESAPVPQMPWKTAADAPGHIKGNITIAGGWGDGATVTVFGGLLPASGRQMTADGTGFYAFIDLPEGDYTVKAECKFGSKSKDVNVAPHEVTTADFNFTVTAQAPVITNVQVKDVTTSGFTVTWDTDIPSTSQVAYGETRVLDRTTAEDNCTLTSHSVIVSGLRSLTPYYFQAVSRAATPNAGYSQVMCTVTKLDCDLIVDNPDGTALPEDGWSSGASATDKYGSNYRFASTLAGGDKFFIWRPNLPVKGNYEVYVWYPKGSNRSKVAPFTVYYDGGSLFDPVNQQIDGTKWEDNAANLNNVMLTPPGGVPFLAGDSGYIELSNNEPSGKLVMADAVKFKLIVETDPPSVPTGLTPWDVKPDRVSLIWNASSDPSGIAGYKIYRDGVQIGASTETSFTDYGLTAGTRYVYAVAAYDGCGNTSEMSEPLGICTLFDPSSKVSVTGGGWVALDDGSKANFQFALKYKKNGSGEAEGIFDYSVGPKDRIKCSNWNWMMVDQLGMTAWFKGTGTTNTGDTVDLLVKVTDCGESTNAGGLAKAAADTFAITVIPQVQSASVQATGDCALGGGNIQIHK